MRSEKFVQFRTQEVIHQHLAWLRFPLHSHSDMGCKSILRDHHAEWDPALHHDFLKFSRDGTVPVSAFNRWLEQDFQFVQAFRYAPAVVGFAV